MEHRVSLSPQGPRRWLPWSSSGTRRYVPRRIVEAARQVSVTHHDDGPLEGM